ncbi:MAG TPA: lysozyme inhibitor LprI family protein [Saprospiraceae bacterium]|nr:lysozyme inhibitor LprI family protein [Saprospiraceae bacterium]
MYIKILLTASFLLAYIICSAQTQAEMNDEADRGFKTADSTLNVVYKKILNEYADDSLFIQNLKRVQRIWLTFRDAEIQLKYPASAGYGSVQRMCYTHYLTDLTNDRVRSLQIWLDGIEEGDVCAGSMKLKN